MNYWPVEVLGVRKQDKYVLFCPFAAKSLGFLVFPFVEINVEEIIDALYNEFEVRINHLKVAEIRIDHSNAIECDLISSEYKFLTIDKSILLKEIEYGGYLEALYFNEKMILAVFGGDESWVVLDTKLSPQRSLEFYRLVEFSKKNINIMKKSKDFEKFISN